MAKAGDLKTGKNLGISLNLCDAMSYEAVISPELEKDMRKIRKKNLVLYERLSKKMLEIVEHPEFYKPLRHEMKGLRRVHIGSFVLVFEVVSDEVHFLALEHHDKAYR